MFIVNVPNRDYLEMNLKQLQVEYNLQPLKEVVNVHGQKHTIAQCYLITTNNDITVFHMLEILHFFFIQTH